MRKVAIITRTKDRPILLKRAMESVLGQTFTNWVHVIVNDGGNVNVVERLAIQLKDRYQGRLQLIHNLESKGMEAASNIGVRASESELLVIHDDDDSWESEFLYEMIRRLHDEQASNPRARGVACYSTIVNEELRGDTIVELNRHSFNQWATSITLWRMLASNYIPPISFLFERPAAEEIGLFDESLEVLGDWDFHIRFLLHYDIALLPAHLARYHHRKNQDGVYANSVRVRENRHELTRTRYVNAKLRNDIAKGQAGVGALINIAFQLDGIRCEVGGSPTRTPDYKLRRRTRRLEVALGVILVVQLAIFAMLLLK